MLFQRTSPTLPPWRANSRSCPCPTTQSSLRRPGQALCSKPPIPIHGHPEVICLALDPYLINHGLQDPSVDELKIFSPELQSSSGIFDGIVSLLAGGLDVFFEEQPGEKAKGEFPPSARAKREKLLGVDDLALGDVYVDGAEIALQAVTDELAAQVEEDPELLVHGLEVNEHEAAGSEGEVTRAKTRELGKIVVDWLIDRDVIVDVWDTLVRLVAAKDRDTCETRAVRASDPTTAICADINLLSQQTDELGVDGAVRCRARQRLR